MSVYFITCREANAVKIGSSLEPHARLREVQWGCPLELKLEAVLPGSSAQEFQFHRRFADDRIRGEWFTITDMIEAVMAANPPGPAPHVTMPGRPVRIHESPTQRARRRATEEAAKTRGASERHLLKLVEAGYVTFPFREKEEA
jgi:hypothetical protein